MSNRYWKVDESFALPLLEYYSEDKMVAWIESAGSSDRGHFKAMVEVPNLVGADSWPNYYMKIETAVDEVERFIEWRLDQVRRPDAGVIKNIPQNS